MIDILVVEPGVSSRKTLERLLESHGYSMRGVTRGADALRQITRQRPDLVLSEVQLPDIGGLELCQQLSLGGLPVLLLSGWMDERLRQGGLAAGALEVIPKPVTETLLSRLAYHLKLPAPVTLPVQPGDGLLSSLMTRPGLLGAALLDAAGQPLEQAGAGIPAPLYGPFLQTLLTPPAETLGVVQEVGAGGTQGGQVSAGPHRIGPGLPTPMLTGAVVPTAGTAAAQVPGADPELHCVQLEFSDACLLLFRLPAPAVDVGSLEPGPADGPPAARALICLIQNNSYASLIKYHLRSSPYVRVPQVSM